VSRRSCERALVLALALVAAPPATAAPRVACADGRFLVPDGRRLLAQAPVRNESIVLAAGTVALTSGCPAVAAKITAGRHGTRVRARWPVCLGRKTRLDAFIRGRTCDTMRGVVRVNGARPHTRAFRAQRAPFAYDVPLDPRSPWPKFRRDATQTGRSP